MSLRRNSRGSCEGIGWQDLGVVKSSDLGARSSEKAVNSSGDRVGSSEGGARSSDLDGLSSGIPEFSSDRPLSLRRNSRKSCEGIGWKDLDLWSRVE